MTKNLKYIFLLFFIPFWYIQLLIPRNKKIWVFGCWFGQGYTDNAKSLFEFVLDNSKGIQPIWITKNKDIYNVLKSKGIPCEMSNSLKGILSCLKSGIYIFSSGKQDINRFVMNGAKSIQLWHGAPMKKIGLDDKFSINMFTENIRKYFFPFNYEYDFDAFVSTSELFNKNLRNAFDLKSDQIITSGYPRNDVFFQLYKKSAYYEKLNLKFKNPKIVLYLPTFRDYEPDIDLFFKFKFNTEVWSKYLNDTNTILVYKSHFAGKFKRSLSFSCNRIIQFSDKEETDLNLFMRDVNLLITDYSGAYFDFKLTNKPIILAPFDLQDYINKSRELYFEYDKLDDVKAVNWIEILELLSGEEIFDYHQKQKSIYNDFNDGNSSKRLYSEIIDKFNVF